MEQNIRLDDVDQTPIADASQFCRLIGHLLYLQVTRHDITLAVNTLSQFVSASWQLHFDVALRILHYLKATPGQGTSVPSTGNLTLKAYCDSDWLGFPLTRRSKNGYFITLGGAPVS